jgi:predicted metal-dependent hydrolase
MKDIMHTLKIDNHQLTYTIIYQKNRKSVQLKLNSSSHLTITAPTRFPKEGIEKIVLEKRKWIVKQITKLAAAAANPINKSVCDNAAILFLGQPHILKFMSKDTHKPPVHLEENQIMLNILPLTAKDTNATAEKILKQWYIHYATNTLVTRTTFWASVIKVNPKRITIKEQKTRWGSCSSKGNINYNWRIIMAPMEVIDYLVIHELCHLRIPNHSQAFWQEVGNYSPHFKQCREWLRTNGALIMAILSCT